jgi:hypothetical protein
MAPEMVTTIGVVLSALVTGLFVYLVQRKKSGTDVQGIINEGFKGLVDKLTDEIKRQAGTINDLQDDIKELREEVAECQITVDHLEEFIRSKGLIPPEVLNGGVKKSHKSHDKEEFHD